MLQNLRRRIFGVPDSDTAAAHNAARWHARDETPLYLPASRLTEDQINGVGPEGDVWAEWRTDADGEVWYQRISATVHGVEPGASIAAYDADPADDADELERIEAEIREERLAHGIDDADDSLTAFRRECAIKKSQYERGEISGFEASDDEFGDGNELV